MFGLGEKAAEKVVLNYVAFLNARNRGGIAALLHPDCRFVDSRGEWLEGRETVIRAVDRFFNLERNFYLTVDSITSHRGDVLLRGMTSADLPELRTDILWRSRVRDGQLSYWQSFGPSSSLPLARILGGDLAQPGI